MKCLCANCGKELKFHVKKGALLILRCIHCDLELMKKIEAIAKGAQKTSVRKEDKDEKRGGA